MKEIRKVDGWFSDEFYSVSHNGSMLCFTHISDDTTIKHFISLKSFCDKFYVSFENTESFRDVILRADEDFLLGLLDRLIEVFLNKVDYRESYYYVFRLFALNFEFPQVELKDNDIGFTLGEIDECQSIQYFDITHANVNMVFRKEFYSEQFFQVEFCKPYSKEVLKKLPKMALFYKIKDFFIKSKYDKPDFPEIINTLNKLSRPDKINKILGD